eukprot:4449162-Pyramimonas_sp.AAC.1
MSGNSKRACNPRKVESRTLQELLQEECVPDENVLTTFNGCAWVSFCWESVEWVSCRRSNLGRHQTRRLQSVDVTLNAFFWTLDANNFFSCFSSLELEHFRL